MRISLLAMLVMLTGCSQHWKPLAGATVGGGVGSIGGPAGAVVGSGFGYTLGELARTDDTLVTAITSGDVAGIVKSQMQGQRTAFEKATDAIWTALKVAAFVVLGFLLIPLFITRSNSKKIKKICDKNDEAT